MREVRRELKILNILLLLEFLPVGCKTLMAIDVQVCPNLWWDLPVSIKLFRDAAFIRIPAVIPILGITIKLSNSIESDQVPVRR